MLEALPEGFEGGMTAKKYMSITRASKSHCHQGFGRNWQKQLCCSNKEEEEVCIITSIYNRKLSCMSPLQALKELLDSQFISEDGNIFQATPLTKVSVCRRSMPWRNTCHRKRTTG